MSNDLERDLDQVLNEGNAGSRSTSVEHKNLDRGVASFFEHDRDETFAKALEGRPMYRQHGRRVSFPKGYQKAGFPSFGAFLRDGMMKDESKFRSQYDPAIKSLAKSLNISTTAFDDGGVLVLPEFAPEILSMLYESNSLWSRTRQYTVAGNSMSFPRLRDNDRRNGQRHGGVLSYWLGEADPITESKINFETTDIKLNKLAVAVFVTDEMLSDSGYAIEQFVTEVVQAEIDYQLDRSLLVGDGVQKPLGFLKSSSRVTVPKESGQANGTVVADNILQMWGRRISDQANNDLVWLVNQDVETILPKMSLATGSASGQLVYMQPTGFAGRQYMTLQGVPVVNCEHCPALGLEGDISLANLKYFLSINKGQVNQLSSPHVQFLRDLMCIKFTFRVNGRPMYDSPITMENSANKRSAFITLQNR